MNASTVSISYSVTSEAVPWALRGDALFVAPPKEPFCWDVQVQQYREERRALVDEKTLKREQNSLAAWRDFLGAQKDFPQAWRSELLSRFVLKRKEQGRNARTINLDVATFLAFVRFLRQRIGVPIVDLTAEWKPLRWRPPVRELIEPARLQRFLDEARRRDAQGRPIWPLGDLVADFVLFCALTGARRSAALHVRWDDINWDRGQLHLTRHMKYGKHVVVDLSPTALQFLRELQGRRSNDVPGRASSPWLFPSPKDPSRPARNLAAARDRICRAANIPRFNFHALRHYFVSRAVMSGIDYLTIAQWVGHADGGLLIGRVYGHLSLEHRRQMAERFTPLPVSPSTGAPPEGPACGHLPVWAG